MTLGSFHETLRRNRSLVICVICAFVLQACTTTRVKTSEVKSLEVAENLTPEHLLLDVGINLFDPGLDSAGDEQSLFPEVREGEARYLPVNLMETMQSTGHWGAVRVVPSTIASVDVHVHGKILESDGERLSLQIEVEDSTGRQWFVNEYSEIISDFVYKKRRAEEEPFQSIYNRISNDIAQYQQQLNAADVRDIRTVAELRFAQDFSPDAFGGHLEKDDDGIYQVLRLPSELDPMLQRVRKIRDRDYLFVDTLQDYYGVFHRQMDVPYMEWRERSYDHAVAIRDLRRTSMTRGIAGAAAVIASIVAIGQGGSVNRAGGSVGLSAGTGLIYSAVQKSQERGQHEADFIEISESVTAAITPQVLELEDQTITLTGTVGDQYQQWRELLREIYRNENGVDVSNTEPASDADSNAAEATALSNDRG
ncbi:MAG: hypothetical protein AB8B48_13335 [Pseudomonadales bacterium]